MLVRTDRGEKGTFLILRCVKSVEAKKSKKGAAGVYLSTYYHGRMDGVSKDGSFGVAWGDHRNTDRVPSRLERRAHPLKPLLREACFYFLKF